MHSENEEDDEMHLFMSAIHEFGSNEDKIHRMR